ncbi:hypothetical protein [Tomitella cavernea]|uniref:Secreted protein n=1 Tax=Tomitella cavernea TaxID=1387982 RepID=A0ABP9CZH5_9ACTN|nr:hypothetical protein [Tomitella cavernea]
MNRGTGRGIRASARTLLTRAGATAGALAVAAAGTVALGAPAAAGASSLDGATQVVDCAHELVKEPADIIIFCGDANGGFTDITWHLWTDQLAVGTANRYWNDCDPACYQGTFHKEPVWIALHDVAAADQGPAFRTLTSVDASGPHDVPLPGFPVSGPIDFP